MNRFFISWLVIIFISFNCVISQSSFVSPTSDTQINKNAFYSGIRNLTINENLYATKIYQDSSILSFEAMPLLYLHLYGGTGFSFLSSSDIKSLLGNDFGIGIGLPTWSWGVVGGYKNILQIEYNNGISDHDFNNNSIIKSIPSKVIKMDYNTTDWQFKLNPLFWNMTKNKAFFLIIGSGDVEWRDESNDGFTGTSQIFGLEYAKISRYLSWSVSFKRYGTTFQKTILFNIPFNIETEASDYILEFKIGFGYGI